MTKLNWFVGNGAGKWAALVVLAALMPGCIKNRPANPATTRPVTAVDPKLATVEYWLAQPATETIALNDFTRLWEACEEVSRDYLLPIERRDFRGGMLVAGPLTSKQVFEFWRRDTGTFDDSLEASLGTIRRTVFFEFVQSGDGGYVVRPKVVVERQAKPGAETRLDITAQGSDSNKRDSKLAAAYWYALRRDAVVEKKMADAVLRKLAGQGVVGK